MKYIEEELTAEIIHSFYNVYNQLGKYLDKSFYKKAMLIDLNESELHVDSNIDLEIKYNDQLIGKLKLDIVVNNKILVEVKTKLLDEEIDFFNSKLIKSELVAGLILVFGEQPIIKRQLNP